MTGVKDVIVGDGNHIKTVAILRPGFVKCFRTDLEALAIEPINLVVHLNRVQDPDLALEIDP